MDRKDFLFKCGAICGTTALLGFMDSCQKQSNTITVDLSLPANAALNNVGGSVVTQNVIVMKTSSGYEALSLICTHAGCLVSFNSGAQQFDCPCHGGRYDINGNVLSGPPPAPLTKYTTALSGHILTVTT
jgi:cytochrome b6-f complex iron-sulfur subunit